MVSHLQQVDARQDAASEEGRLDRSLGVAGEQRCEPAVAQDQHDRSVVDVALGSRGRGVGRGRINDFDRGLGIQRQPWPARANVAGTIGSEAASASSRSFAAFWNGMPACSSRPIWNRSRTSTKPATWS